ncbi:MAG: C25 family cysteine peptidase [bacterium]|nr:C25 family cysteine peptidase [bacterium]
MHICILVLVSITSGLTQISKSVYFNEADVSLKTYNNYTVPGFSNNTKSSFITFNKTEAFLDMPGNPQLPVKCIRFLIPEDKSVKSARIETSNFIYLSSEYNILSAQPPQIISMPVKKSFVPPNPIVYNSNSEYPGKTFEFKGEGNIRNYKVAEVLVYPLQYIPATKKLKLYTELKICLELEPSKLQQSNQKYTFAPVFEDLVKSVIINPEDFVSTKCKFSNNGYEYLIITADSLVSVFESFANWKNARGVKTVIRTTEWINTSYSGRDLAEKIRNFIKFAADSGVVWVLLGGDVDIVPSRSAYAMTSNAGAMQNEDSIPSDLYYSDLDGTWDTNGNGTFGETADNVDLYPDVFVGRAPVKSSNDVINFVNKNIKYEENPSNSYLNNALFFAEVLWTSPYTDAGVGKDMIGNLFPQNFSIEKLYESKANENRTSVINAINSGKALLNHDGHGWINLMGTGPDALGITDVDTLKNNNAQGILYSIGCWVGAFDYNCIAEHWVLNPNGGGVAAIANSRYGWGSPGNPGYGYSDKIDEDFYFNLFKSNITKIGKTLATTKLDYVPFSRDKNVYRWHQYELNLFGDPELDIYTDTLSMLNVECPDSLPVGTSKLKINVRNDNTPVANALVCCYKGNEVYERDFTNESGEINFTISPSSAGNLLLTVTGHNFYQYQSIIKIFGAGANPGYYSHSIIDSNSNGEINTGEKIDITVELKNFGSQTANNVNTVLRTQDSFMILIDSTNSFGNILPDSIKSGAFSFRVRNDCPNNQILHSLLNIAGFNSVPLNFTAQTPEIVYKSCSTAVMPYPGDTIELYISIEDSGGIANNVISELYTQNPQYITMIDSIKNFGLISHNYLATMPYKIIINPICPVPSYQKFTIISTTGAYSFKDSFWLNIGQEKNCFSDNFESDTDWTTGGTNNNWLLTAHGAHSGAYSYYCGNAGQWEYNNNTNCWLKSPEFILGPDSYLSFWSWFNVTTYGVDGIYLEVGRNTVWDTLDFIGSGGALANKDTADKYFSNDWMPRFYSLLSYPVGCTLRVRFSFISDNKNVAEGFYIDDINVGPLQEFPLINKTNISVKDSNNNIVEAGEKINITASLTAENKDFSSVYVILRTTDSLVNIIDDSVYFGDISMNEFVNGTFSFVSQTGLSIGHKMRFSLNIKGTGYENRNEFVIKIGDKCGIEDSSISDLGLRNAELRIEPNPFVKSTVVSYKLLAKDTKAEITIYDITGRMVKNITLSTKLLTNTVKWDATDYSSGVYFIKLSAGEYKVIRKVILIQ